MANVHIRGVDFGTSTSLISESAGFEPVVVPMGTVDPWLPSLIGMQGGEWRIGEAASLLPQRQVIRSIKRAITEDLWTLSVSNGEDRVDVDVDEAIKAILARLVATAGDNFVDLAEQGTVRLGCPAMWTGKQRQRLIRLANEAGLAVGDTTLIDEPIAAGIAWISEMTRKGLAVNGKVLVFDMGGGTLDVAVLDVAAAPGKQPSIAVQSAVGVGRAGDALDETIVDELEAKYAEAGVVIESTLLRAELRSWLKLAAGRAKVELGSEVDVPIVLSIPGFDLPVVNYSREELEAAFQPQLDAALDTVWWALRAALMSQVAARDQPISMKPSVARGKKPAELAAGIKYVLLAGGMAHVPAVLNRLSSHFDADRIFLGADGKPTETIVSGLGEHAAYEGLNLHRPGFDFVLSWLDSDTGESSKRLVYGAYTPLYSAGSVLITDSAKHVWKPVPGDLPRKGTGELSVQSVSGQRIQFNYRGTEGDSIPLAFGQGDFVISLEPNGRVFMRDSSGRTKAMRIAQWPVIRGVGFEAITLVDLEDEKHKVPDLVWHQKPYD